MLISYQIEFDISFDPLDMEWYTWLHICGHVIRMLDIKTSNFQFKSKLVSVITTSQLVNIMSV